MRNIFKIALFLGALFIGFRSIGNDVSYNEAITLLELSGQAQYPWPDKPFLGQKYLDSLESNSTSGQVAEVILDSDTHPPLYYLCAWSWGEVFGRSIASIRVLSLLCAFLLCGLYFIFISKESTPLLLALILSNNDLVSARGYALALLFLVLIRCVDKINLKTGLCAGLAFSTHYFTVLIIFPWLVLKILKKQCKNLLAFIIGGCATGSIGLYFLTRQFSCRQGQFQNFPGVENEFLAALQGISALFFSNTFSSYELLTCSILILSILGFGIYRMWNERIIIDEYIIFLIYICALISVDFLSNKSVITEGPSRYWIFLIPTIVEMIVGVNYKNKVNSLISLLAVLILVNKTFVQKNSDFDKILTENQTKLLVIDAGFGRGNPGKIIHKLKSLEYQNEIFVLTDGNSKQLAPINQSKYLIKSLQK